MAFKRRPAKFITIRQFWEAEKEAGELVEIRGTLSKFAPFLPGNPNLKRTLHREYRRAILEEDYEANETTVDAYLAFTAGQMVWRLDQLDQKKQKRVYLGLYHGIVRNSISILVDKGYYDHTVAQIFDQGRSQDTVEVVVRGILERIPENIMARFIENHGLKDRVSPELLDALGTEFGITVSGRAGTRIKYSGSTRYLDGDIWVVVEQDGKEHFVSRFLDLSDPNDVKNESDCLHADVASLFPDGRIVFRFDQTEPLVDGHTEEAGERPPQRDT